MLGNTNKIICSTFVLRSKESNGVQQLATALISEFSSEAPWCFKDEVTHRQPQFTHLTHKTGKCISIQRSYVGVAVVN